MTDHLGTSRKQGEDFEMLRALYDFKATIDQTLDFQRNDHFILHSSSNREKNWWHVINIDGKIGYIPSNYIETVWVSPKFMLNFLSRCVMIMQKEISLNENSAGGTGVSAGGNRRHQLLKELNDRKRRVEGGMRSPIPPRPPTRGPNTSVSPSPTPTPAPICCDLITNSVSANNTPTKTLKKSATAQSFSTTGHNNAVAVKQHRPIRSCVSDASERTMSNNCCSEVCCHCSVIDYNNDDNKIISNCNNNGLLNCNNKGGDGDNIDRSSINNNTKRAVCNLYGTLKSSTPNVSNIDSGGIKRCNSVSEGTGIGRRNPCDASSSLNRTNNNDNNSSLVMAAMISTNSSNVNVTELEVYRLIQQVRRHSELGFDLSRVAVGVVISNLIDILPVSSANTLNAMLKMLKGDLHPPDHMLDDTHDARRLRTVLYELVTCKEDAQQRSWELYEDESTIIEYLNELISILNNADPLISRRVLSRDKFRDVSELLEYYQMEVRWSIRRLLLEAFAVMCGLHATVITLFLNSVLPMELARDMQTNAKNIPRLISSSDVLTMIFCMGEPMPITHLEYIGCDFISFLLSMMEDSPETDIQEQIPEAFFKLILSYNLQFTPLSSNNVVVEALSKRNSAKAFTEKILFVLNREEDPVRMFDHEPNPPNSTLKLVGDMFTSIKAADLFYTNDINVLIDIIVRQLTDLSPGDNKRTKYLELCRLVLRNTNYGENQHRCSDLHRCFTRIFCEETLASNKDQLVVREISNEFPQYFKA